jgi:hypothetical protein
LGTLAGVSVTVRGDFEAVEVSWWWEPRADGRHIELSDRITARGVLARLSGRVGFTRALRSFASDRLSGALWRLDDAALLDQIAAWVSSGSIRIATTQCAPLVLTLPEREEVEAEVAWDARPEPEPDVEARPAKEPPTFPPDIDALAIARANKEAARRGAPFFRYYDPRVMRIYLPTCNAGELRTLFGPVGLYVMEGEDPTTLLRYHRAEDALEQSSVRLDSA